MAEKIGRIEIVIKGGHPWGFCLQTKAENRSVVIVNEIVQGGKADKQGELRVGDHVIKINGIQCLSLADALQLIDSAFRTLTILVWRSSSFLERDRSRDYINVALPLQQISNNSYPFAHSNSLTTPIYENLEDFTFQDNQRSCRKSSPVESVYGFNSNDNLTNTRYSDANNFKVQSDRTDYHADSINIPNAFSDKYLVNEPEKKYQNIYNHEGNLSSKTSKSIRQCSNAHNFQQLPALDSISNSRQRRIAGLYEASYQQHVPFLQIKQNYAAKNVNNYNFEQCSPKNLLSDDDSSFKSDCCMYPNCHNKYFNCKIHSPPERDTTTTSIRQSFKNVNNYENVDFISHSDLCQDQIHCDKLNYVQSADNIPVLNFVSSSTRNEVFKNRILKLEKDSVPSKLYNSPYVFNSSARQSSRKLEESKSCITSESNAFSNSEENRAVSYHASSDVDFEKDNTQILPYRMITNSNIPNATMVGQLNYHSFSSQVKEKMNNSLYSFCSESSLNKTTVTYVNEASILKEKDMFIDASNNSLCMISKEATVVKLISPRPEQRYLNEDEEIEEINKNKNLSALSYSSSNISPPLPSPPPETETEILPYDEPLPPPPSFSSVTNLYHGEQNNDVVESIYANLEMLKIQCSVMNSSSQTNILQNNLSVRNSSSPDVTTTFSVNQSSPLMLSGSATGTSKSDIDTSFINQVIHSQEEKIYKKLTNLPFTSAYFTTSVPKAKFLTRYVSKLHSKSVTGVMELSSEKEGLMSSIKKKLDILQEEKAALQDEMLQNDELGNSLSEKLGKSAEQNEFKKFTNYVSELEKITNLLLFLSGRLARAENALLISPPDTSVEEKRLLESKYNKLTQQYDEALHLQRNIDKRNKQVLLCLQKYFTEDELADYDHFIKMKVKLLVDYKELDEKIKLGDEQLKALTDS